MGNVPLYTRLSQNRLKLSGFIELNELIILVLNYHTLAFRFRLKLVKYDLQNFGKNMQN